MAARRAAELARRITPSANPPYCACGKQIRTPLDWSGLAWCFYQRNLSRSKPVRRNARRVFALVRITATAVIPDAPLRIADARLREPGIHNHRREYGFRAFAQEGASTMRNCASENDERNVNFRGEISHDFPDHQVRHRRAALQLCRSPRGTDRGQQRGPSTGVSGMKARSSLYPAEIADRILGELRAGRSLHDICRDEGMPHHDTITNWVKQDREGFAARYRQARQIGHGSSGYVCYTPETADRFLGELMNGRTLGDVCGDPDMPDH